MNIKSWIKWPLMAIFFAISLTACDDDDDEDLIGNWAYDCDFSGWSRSGAVSFVIDNTAYVGLGYNNEEDERLNDFYKFDGTTWTEIAKFPGVKRNYAVAFAANGKAYVGSGYDGTIKLKDFYCYDPATNSWSEVANEFPGTARYGAIAFGIGANGYVGTGYDGSALNDFYKFDTNTQTWSKIADIGKKRRDAAVFVIDEVAYVIGGVNSSMLNDMYKFDPKGEKWVELRKISDVTDESFDDDYDDIKGSFKATFVMGGLGYLTTGGSNAAGTSTWEYDPKTDLWEERTSFEGNSRMEAVGFTIKGQGYVATGRTSSKDFDDVYRFEPTAEQDDDDNY